MKIESLKLVEELSKTNKSMSQQLKIFKEKTGKHTATFYRHRKKLGIHRKNRKNGKNFYGLRVKGKCYFCLKKATDTHHINKNKKDNHKRNLLLLCKGYYSKIHRILNNIQFL